MTAPTTSTTAAAPATSPGHDWTNQAVDTIESVVLSVRDKTTVPAITAARALVYGLVIAAVATLMLVVLSVGVFRAIDAYLVGWLGTAHGQHRDYVAYLAVGALLTVGGMVCWSRRRA